MSKIEYLDRNEIIEEAKKLPDKIFGRIELTRSEVDDGGSVFYSTFFGEFKHISTMLAKGLANAMCEACDEQYHEIFLSEFIKTVRWYIDDINKSDK